MITETYNHRNGEDVIPISQIHEIRNLVENYRKKIGLYKIGDFKAYLLPELKKHGWSDEYYLDRTSNITITAIKEKTGLCVQTGNMARTYADLIKLQAIYMKSSITGGILILADNECAKEFGANVANFQRCVRELKIFDQVITIPLIIIGFNNE